MTTAPTLVGELKIGISIASALAGLYVAGAIAIHINGPSAFIFREMGLPGVSSQNLMEPLR